VIGADLRGFASDHCYVNAKTASTNFALSPEGCESPMKSVSTFDKYKTTSCLDGVVAELSP
jgi:hypothetical protein